MTDDPHPAFSHFLSQLRYNPLTGFFYLRDPFRRGVYFRCDYITGKGTRYAKVVVYWPLARRQLIAARLAMRVVTGSWPVGLVDHKNRDPTDCRYSNLRDVTYSQNRLNSIPRVRNRTGYQGVTETRDGFRAKVCIKGRRHDLGLYPTPVEAHLAYLFAYQRAGLIDFLPPELTELPRLRLAA